MKLKSYLLEHDISVKEFAEKLGSSYWYISHIVSGKRKPSARLAHEIRKLTEPDIILAHKTKENHLGGKPPTNNPLCLCPTCGKKMQYKRYKKILEAENQFFYTRSE